MPRGGARPGSGRPRGTMDPDTKIRMALKSRWLSRINKIADQIFDAHEAVALGHYREVESPDGRVRIYKKSPDGDALRWMQEHIWGLAPMKLDLEAHVDVVHSLSIEAQAQIKQAIAYALPSKLRNASIIDGTVIDAVAKADGGSELLAGPDPARPELPHRSGE